MLQSAARLRGDGAWDIDGVVDSGRVRSWQSSSNPIFIPSLLLVQPYELKQWSIDTPHRIILLVESSFKTLDPASVVGELGGLGIEVCVKGCYLLRRSGESCATKRPTSGGCLLVDSNIGC